MSLSDEAVDQTVAPRILKLSGRVAVVTGSDSGIGRAIAEAYAMEGADVAVTFHSDRDGAEATAQQVKDAGRRAIVERLDVADEESVVRLFRP
jgi:glucose 1-dehydrogenase